MPAGVVVVKRARRRAFALLWAGPAWLRSMLSSLGRAPDPPEPALGVDAAPGATFPGLVLDAEGAHRCTACEACVPLCPSACLRVVSREGVLTRLELDPGACIGCGRCVEVCPEAALLARPAPAILVPAESGRAVGIDLCGDATPAAAAEGSA